MSSKKMVAHQDAHQYFNSVTVPKGQCLTNIYNTKTELQFEIECPRCYDNMTLCSDFNGL